MPKHVARYVVWDLSEDSQHGGSFADPDDAVEESFKLEYELSWFQRFLDWLNGRQQRFEARLVLEQVWLPHEYHDD